MDRERPRPALRPQPGADDGAVELEPGGRAGLVRRPLTCREQRTVRDPDGRQVANSAQVQREAGATRMVAAGRIDEHDIRTLAERANGGQEQRALAQREQARLVGSSRLACDDGARDDSPVTHDRRARPARLALAARSGRAALEADEAAADGEPAVRRAPRRRPHASELLLRANERVGRFRPFAHRRILAHGRRSAR
jgi:hypothetical protein